MRLIDADEFITNLKDYIDKPMTAGLCVTLVESVPTAYDIGKVVEKLEKQRDIIFQDTDSEIKTVRTNAWDKIDVLNKAIEIVKHGGASDDVCEAKQGKWIFDKFTAKYGNPYRCSCCSEEFGYTYNYCPNCGVGMKEVE